MEGAGRAAVVTRWFERRSKCDTRTMKRHVHLCMYLVPLSSRALYAPVQRVVGAQPGTLAADRALLPSPQPATRCAVASCRTCCVHDTFTGSKMATVSSLSLESYLQLRQALTKGQSAVKPVQQFEEAFYKPNDLKQVLVPPFGAALGDQQQSITCTTHWCPARCAGAHIAWHPFQQQSRAR